MSKPTKSLANELEETVAAIDAKPRKYGSITIKPVKIYNRQIGNTHGVSVLPGAKHVYGTTADRFGTLLTGFTEDEFKQLEISKEITHKLFFRDFKLILTDAPVVLNLERESDYIRYKFALIRDEIANTPDDITSQTKYVMFDEEAEAVKLTVKADLKMDAYVLLSGLSYEEQLDFLKLFGIATKGLSPTVVKAKLAMIIETDSKSFLSRYNDKNRGEKILIESLVQARIVEKRGTSIYFNEDLLGATEDITIQYLKNPKNNELRINLITLLKSTQG